MHGMHGAHTWWCQKQAQGSWHRAFVGGALGSGAFAGGAAHLMAAPFSHRSATAAGTVAAPSSPFRMVPTCCRSGLRIKIRKKGLHTSWPECTYAC